MIKEVKMYACICDNCGDMYETFDGICAWTDEDSCKEIMGEQTEWIEHEGKHYCDVCAIEWDDNDNLILKNKETNYPSFSLQKGK